MDKKKKKKKNCIIVPCSRITGVNTFASVIQCDPYGPLGWVPWKQKLRSSAENPGLSEPLFSAWSKLQTALQGSVLTAVLPLFLCPFFLLCL